MTEAEKLREAVRQEWEDEVRVEAWRKWHGKFVTQTRAATEAIVGAAQLKPGMRVLDLASGPGEPALTIAGAVQPGGQVTATDLVGGMLKAAAENARQQALTNIAFQRASAESLPFPEESFDVVTCRFGIMFVPEVGRALAEIGRVLRPGGRAVFMAWGPPEQNPTYLKTTGVLAKYVDIPAPVPGAPDGYRFAEPGTLASALRQAGLQQVSEEALIVPWPWPGSIEEAWESLRDLRGAPFRRNLAKVPPGQMPRVMEEIFAGIGEYYDGRQVNFTAALVLASGVKPTPGS